MKKFFIASASVLALSAGAALAQSPGQSSTSGMVQDGTGNTATIDQTLNNGASNTSNVYQGVNGNKLAASSSSVSVTQIGGLKSQATSTVTQNDSSQSATVSQNGTNGGQLTSVVSQSGGNNAATVAQVSANTTDIQNAIVTQTGTHGTASVSQQGPSNGAAVTQTGNNYSRATVIQAGTGDTAGAAGPVSTAAAGLVDSGVNVNQIGSSTNTAGVSQYSDYSGVSVSQGGAGGINSATINQWSGSDNWAGVSQSAAPGATNGATIQQSGTWNVASVKQR